MSKKHAKKRNVGLIYEFLVRDISTALIEGDEKRSNRALKILKRHYKPGTELYKEFRLLHALYRTTVSSDAVASSIIQETKAAAKTHNATQLMREKSLLIREINHRLNNEKFYDQPVNDYRTYATIQSLFEEWRNPTGDIRMLAEYEDNLVKWLVSPKVENHNASLGENDPGTTRLLVKMMTKRLNEQYADVLNDDQRALLREYALSSSDTTGIVKQFNSIRTRLFEAIDTSSKDDAVNEKMNELREMLTLEENVKPDDDAVVRFMMYAKLLHELGAGK